MSDYSKEDSSQADSLLPSPHLFTPCLDPFSDTDTLHYYAEPSQHSSEPEEQGHKDRCFWAEGPLKVLESEGDLMR